MKRVLVDSHMSSLILIPIKEEKKPELLSAIFLKQTFVRMKILIKQIAAGFLNGKLDMVIYFCL